MPQKSTWVLNFLKSHSDFNLRVLQWKIIRTVDCIEGGMVKTMWFGEKCIKLSMQKIRCWIGYVRTYLGKSFVLDTCDFALQLRDWMRSLDTVPVAQIKCMYSVLLHRKFRSSETVAISPRKCSWVGKPNLQILTSGHRVWFANGRAGNLDFLTHEPFVLSSGCTVSLEYSIMETYSRNEDTKC